VVETTSTSDDAPVAARAGAPHGATWVADSQTAGRGRQGRQWIAAPRSALLASVVLRQPCALAQAPAISIAAGLAALASVDALLKTPRAQLKWPNDVLVDRRKIAGVLVEAMGMSAASESGAAVARGDGAPRSGATFIVGVGINVYCTEWPEEIRARAISLEEAGMAERRSASAGDLRADLLVELLRSLERIVPRVAAHGLAPFRAWIDGVDGLRGQAVHSDGRSGTALGIADDGALRVDAMGTAVAAAAGHGAGERRPEERSEQRWYAGEVHLGPLARPLVGPRTGSATGSRL
jgi:BirA family biotin operon repressor/biotin-[acetyl-CoA-carboxylase] ligase